MKLERVLQMSVDEVMVRGRQEASKWLDWMAAVAAPVTVPDRGEPRNGALRRRSAGALVNHFRERVPLCFFEGAATADRTARLIERIPGSRERIVAAADAICGGRFDLLGYRGLDFGDPVDWRLDPVSGRRAPLVHWSRIDPLDPAVVGDSRVVWELNRHQWLLHLGQAYRFTGDERYAEAFARYMRDWMRANPAGMGINWAASLTVAFRLISWCWALVLFEGSRALSAELLTELLAGIEDHARHVERYLALYFSPNTHLTGEALALVYAGLFCPDRSRAGRWRARGAEILIQQSERQIFADGVYFEQSTCYQRYTAEIYLHFLILAARNEIALPDTVADRLKRLLDFLVAVRRPDGSMPQIGDADGGWLLPLVPRAPDDLRGVLSVAAAFFGRSDYAWAAGGLAPDALWLLGTSAARALEPLRPAPPADALTRLFPQGGYAVMRSGWERDAHQLIFDVGAVGLPKTGGHGHADLLGIQCSAFGEPYIVDPGTFGYTADPAWRDFFRGTAAHSTVTIDGAPQVVPAGPFAWRSRPETRVRRWRSSETDTVVEAEHDAYDRLPDAVRHRRRVLFMKPGCWVVVDDLEGAAEHRVDLRFQFAPMEVTMGPDLWARARGRRGHGLLLRPFAMVALTAEIHEGEMAPIQGWVSDDYGRRAPAPVLVYSTRTQLPLRIATILLPAADLLAPVPVVSPLVDGRGGLAGLELLDRRVQIRFGDDGDIEVGRPDRSQGFPPPGLGNSPRMFPGSQP